ncbi:hypothetical protein DITRI_Ditri12bG0085300 [Diplodiscus trichospermus]
MNKGDWPADMLTEILSKLPVKSIVRFKCVAKTWCDLFKNPTFISQHLSISKRNNYLLVDYQNNGGENVMHLFVYQTLISYNDLPLQPPNHITCMNDSFCVYDGLFCLLDVFNYHITLWNPATREFRILPECNQNIPPKIEYCRHILGFGLDPLSNDYKVIYIRTYFNRKKRTRERHHAIYRMSTDSWRVLEVEDVLFFRELHISPNYNNTCVNGVYYWQASKLQASKVLCFHLNTEAFELIKSPISGSGKLLPLHEYRISMWDTERIERTNEIWVLSNDGHWTKLLKIDPLLKVERMFGFWKKNKVFIESESGQLLLYDLDIKELSDVGIKALEVGDIDVYIYDESLVSTSRD